MVPSSKPVEERSGGSRRDFCKAAAAAGAASLFAAPYVIADDRVAGANERIGVGMIGLGGRFNWCHYDILKKLKSDGRVDVVALCDIYRPRLKAAQEKLGGKMYDHHKELLEDSKVDVVCIATPDRHHAPMAIDAIRAGKDVYTEKPMTHWTQFDSAKQLEEESKKHSKIVQIGTQWVADTAYDTAKEYIKQGVVGEIKQVQCGYFRRGDWGEALMEIPDPNAKPGPDLDWEAFLGEAPKVPYDLWRFFRWRLYWDYCGGPATDFFTHVFTPVFRLLDLDFPTRVVAGGGRMQYPAPREVPDQFNMVVDYAHGPSVVIMNSMSNDRRTETILRGTEGTIIFDDIEHQLQPKNMGLRICPVDKQNKAMKEINIPWNGVGNTGKLWSNFLDCVKSRQRPFSPIDIGVRVHAPLIMGVLSFREDKVAKFDKANQAIVL
jgi:predicted dehydrogenase